MELLRRTWLVAIACVVAIGAGSAFVMRVELVDPGKTLSPTVYSHVFSLHAVAMIGGLLAAFVAIPTLVIRPGRATVVLGSIAFAVWALAMACLLLAAVAPDDWITGSPLGPGSLRDAVVVLAVAAGIGVVQLAASLPVNAGEQGRRTAIAAVGAIGALAIIGISLATGKLPSAVPLVAATTLVVGTAVREWRVVGPCLGAAWIATAFLHGVQISFLPDTVATVAPFPALGAAVLAVLFVAVTRGRVLRPRLARVAAALFAGGAIATSAGFLLLGTRGMPRRYQAYDDLFQPLQITIGVAAAVMLVGALLALSSARPSSRTRA